MEEIAISLRGESLLSNPMYNKGTAFTQKERDDLGLNGLIPSHISSMEEQLVLQYQNFSKLKGSLEKYQYLSNLHRSNETLFYRLLQEHLTEMLPLVYTPTVGEVSQNFSELYQGHRGLYVSYPLRNKMETLIQNLSYKEIEVIVITDGERILGLGDLGIGGMAIPIGKLCLYTLFAGTHPAKTLPVVLDVGTNNEKLLKSPHYLGWKSARLRGKAFDGFVEKFVKLIKKRYPKVLFQWEDFGKVNAGRLLEKYREKICSFNDDIQGTAAVTLAAILTAAKVKKGSLKEERFAVLGGGSAGIGICSQICFALMQEGLSEKEALDRFYIIDRQGLVHDKVVSLDPALSRFARSYTRLKSWLCEKPGSFSLLDVMVNAKPTVLIGVSGQGGAFTEKMIRAMAKGAPRPVIFPLSNPNACAEATPEDIMKWSEGKAIIATGSPFPELIHKGKRIRVAQCNNVYIFPGVGLGVIASKTPKITDSMFLAAARELSLYSPMLSQPLEPLFPPFEKLKEICKKIALAVFQVAIDEKLVKKCSRKEMEKKISLKIWHPEYPKLKAKR